MVFVQQPQLTVYCVVLIIVQQDGMMFLGKVAPGIQVPDGSFRAFSSGFIPNF